MDVYDAESFPYSPLSSRPKGKAALDLPLVCNQAVLLVLARDVGRPHLTGGKCPARRRTLIRSARQTMPDHQRHRLGSAFKKAALWCPSSGLLKHKFTLAYPDVG